MYGQEKYARKGRARCAKTNMNRRQARETVFKLLFEGTFHEGRDLAEAYATALEEQGWEDDAYVKEVYFGVGENLAALDEMIEQHSRGWKKSRISPVSLSILRLACYEMSYRKDIPYQVSINEALELVKSYDDEGARSFVNGILGSFSRDEAGQ